MPLIPVIELCFLYNWVKKPLNSDEKEERYGGLKFKVFANLQNLTCYISLTIMTKTMPLIPVIELSFLFNWVKKSLNSDEKEERYGGLKFKVFANLQILTCYISLTIMTKTMPLIPVIELSFLYNWVKKSLNSDEKEERYGGLKFKVFVNPKILTCYISLTIMTKTMPLIPVIELCFLYNWGKKSLNSDEKEERYGGLKFTVFANLQILTCYISLTITTKTMPIIPVIELCFLYNWVKKSLNPDEKEERYRGLKFKVFANPKILTCYITLTIMTKTMPLIPVIELSFLYNE
uniref:Uncharacterized protein n=1 Tax=Rhodnius prolixus TaxID=13249 RepID=T1I2U9_RHOPR